jgi:hypothetical protein
MRTTTYERLILDPLDADALLDGGRRCRRL